MRRSFVALLLLAVLMPAALPALAPSLPNLPGTAKFAVIGDNGTGDEPQYEVGQQMATARGTFRFDLVIMMGDNFYGRQGPMDLRKKFDLPYAALLEAGVKFQAALGNHDKAETVHYEPLGMHGARYYTFAHRNIRFVVLDTNRLDAAQIDWFDAVLREAREPWRICYFHHPLYSNAGRHGDNVDIRVQLEPILQRHAVDVVFSGHDHVYERLKPQGGIHYFVVGSSGRLRKGDLVTSPTFAAGHDTDQAFMLVEAEPDVLTFQTITRAGETVDSGTVPRRRKPGES